MATQSLTEYERRRLENIRRNDEMMASLKIYSAASKLPPVTSKRSRSESSKAQKGSLEKKNKAQTPVVIRRSLRTRGIPPDSRAKSNEHEFSDIKARTLDNYSLRLLGPISTKDAYNGSGSDKPLLDALKAYSSKSKRKHGEEEEENEEIKKGDKFDVGSMSLQAANIARIVQGRIMMVKFRPCRDIRMVAVGNKSGHVGFWNLDFKGEEEDKDDVEGIYLYQPHAGPVSAISFHQNNLAKVYTSCYDGFVRAMDAEKEVFDLLYSGEDSIYSLSQDPGNGKVLYFGEGHGGLNVWDGRAGKLSYQWNLHENRINSIDFNSQNLNTMATSSSDGTACLWDLRSVKKQKPNSLTTVNHERAVHSAYFSPSGSYLATTSFDDRVGIVGGANFEDASMIYHYNQTGRWISSFRGIWGWDDSCIFIGNMKRGVDVISVAERRTVRTLQSPLVSAIPSRFDAHPSLVGMLAGATGGGQVYIWTSQLD